MFEMIPIVVLGFFLADLVLGSMLPRFYVRVALPIRTLAIPIRPAGGAAAPAPDPVGDPVGNPAGLRMRLEAAFPAYRFNHDDHRVWFSSRFDRAGRRSFFSAGRGASSSAGEKPGAASISSACRSRSCSSSSHRSWRSTPASCSAGSSWRSSPDSWPSPCSSRTGSSAPSSRRSASRRKRTDGEEGDGGSGRIWNDYYQSHDEHSVRFDDWIEKHLDRFRPMLVNCGIRLRLRLRE